MKPEPSPPSHQGTGTKNDKSGKTVADESIPAENRVHAGENEGPAEGALPRDQTRPQTSGVEDEVSRGISGALRGRQQPR